MANIWWSEGWVAAIGMLNVAAAQPGTNNGVTEYSYTPSCGSCGSHTSGISVDKQGLIWLDDSLQNTFGLFPVGGGLSLSIMLEVTLMMASMLILKSHLV